MVRERSDATVRISIEPGKSLIEEWGSHPARTPESQTRVDELEIEGAAIPGNRSIITLFARSRCGEPTWHLRGIGAHLP